MHKEIVGRGCYHRIPEVIRALGVDRLLLVTGGESYASCGAKAAFDTLLGEFQVTVFNAFSPNIDVRDTIAGAQICRTARAQAILAVGGGSAIDMAKCIAALVDVPGCEHDLVTGKIQLTEAVVPIVAVPTTGGTGSEATHFAVVYVDGAKYSLASPWLMPAVAVLDATFTDSLPPYITACSGFDALCQSIESYWAVAATDTSRRYAQEAIPLLLATLPSVVSQPTDTDRDNMMLAANLAGKAINISKTTAPHALSYTITSGYGVPHGHAVALTLGSFFAVHDPDSGAAINPALSAEHYQANFDRLLDLMGIPDAAAATSFWYDLMTQCGLHCKLGGDHTADTQAIERIVAGVNLERMANHPVLLSAQQLQDLLGTIPWR